MTIYNNWSSDSAQDVLQKDQVNSSQNMAITIGAVNKDIKRKVKFCRQPWT